MFPRRKSTSKFFSIFLAILLTLSLFTPISALADSHSAKKDLSLDRVNKIKEVVNAQESQLQRKGEINPRLLRQTFSTDSTVSVIVQLSEAPVALEKGKSTIQKKTLSKAQELSIKNKVNLQQVDLEKQLKSQNISYEKSNAFDHVLNAVVLKVKTSDLEKIASIPGVVSIDPNDEVHALVEPSDDVGAHMIDSNPHLGIPEIWEGGNEGEGVKVGVIDSGIDYDHPDLKDVYKGGKNFVEHDDDYARGRDENDPYETSPADWPDHMPEFDANGRSFYTSHGTHVAGIIAGAGNNEYGIKGVAPKVDLYAYRVLGAYGSGTMSGVVDGIEQAVLDEMDVINLSLGGGSNSEHDPTSIAADNATLEGVIVVSATGNSGPGLGTIGTPATSPLGIAVGNTTLPEVMFSATVQVEAGNYTNESDIALMSHTFGENPGEVLTDEYDIVAIPGIGAPEDFEGLDVEGKVALISRGDIPFVDKIYAAKDAGAVATIIHNHEGSGPANVSLGDAFDFLPTFDMSTEEGFALRDALEANAGKVSFANFDSTVIPGDEMNPSSSNGPSTPNFDIKPDVVAPGTNIMAAIPAYQKDYPENTYDQAFDRKTGTSMAAPHVAGIVALLLAENPDWDSYDVKVALSNTAKKLDTKYSVFEQGAGLVQPAKALNPEVLAYAKDTRISEKGEEVRNDKGTINFGRFAPDENEAIIETVEIDVQSQNGFSEQLNVEIEEITKGTGASLSVDKSSFTLSGTETITVTLTVEPGEDIPGNEFLGYINITGENTDISLPYAVELSGEVPTGLAHYFLDDKAISPNGDGLFDVTNLNFALHDAQSGIVFEVWSPVDPGPAGDNYIGYLDMGNIPAGSYYLPIDGTYYDWFTGQPTDMPDGIYTIDFNNYSSPEPEVMAYAPLIVKRDNPKILFDQVDEEQVELTGTIDDQFIDFKEIWEVAFEEEYDVNDYLIVTYELVDEDGEVVDEGDVKLEQDGEFNVKLSEVDSGEYTFVLNVIDIVANSTEEAIDLTVAQDPEEPEEPEQPEEFTITLTPSTTDPTDEAVTVAVETDSEADLVSVKWLEGKVTEDDFAEAGYDIDLDELSFDVEANNYYTVYVKNSNGAEAVETIAVLNILDPEQGDIDAELELETTEPVEESVEVKVIVDEDVETLKWLPGALQIKDFEVEPEADENEDVSAAQEVEVIGNDIDLETKTFEVTENGIYTVYARDSDGERGVFLISVENIVEEAEEPEEFNVTLTPSTTDETEDAVTVSVETDSEADIVLAKWLEGEHSAEDFAEAGNDIEGMEFEVTENGTYTVYVLNSEDVESIATITIDNIVQPEEPEEPGEPDPEEPEEPEQPGDPDPEDPSDPDPEDPTDPEDPETPGTDPTDPEDPEEEPGEEDPDSDDNDSDDDGAGTEEESDDGTSGGIPKTATPWYNYLLFGTILMAIGAAIIFVRRFEHKLFFKE